MSQIFIAEVKTQSPFGYRSEHSFIELLETADKFGDWVSIHDNALWGGDLEAITFARRYTSRPILAKGFHATDDSITSAIRHGANYVLVVDRIPHPQLWSKCLFEWNCFAHFKQAQDQEDDRFDKQKFVCNSRNLRTGKPKQDNELPNYLNEKVWVCQASGIRTPADVNPLANAFIVGEHLMEYVSCLYGDA